MVWMLAVALMAAPVDAVYVTRSKAVTCSDGKSRQPRVGARLTVVKRARGRYLVIVPSRSGRETAWLLRRDVVPVTATPTRLERFLAVIGRQPIVDSVAQRKGVLTAVVSSEWASAPYEARFLIAMALWIAWQAANQGGTPSRCAVVVLDGTGKRVATSDAEGTWVGMEPRPPR